MLLLKYLGIFCVKMNNNELILGKCFLKSVGQVKMLLVKLVLYASFQFLHLSYLLHNYSMFHKKYCHM